MDGARGAETAKSVLDAGGLDTAFVAALFFANASLALAAFSALDRFVGCSSAGGISLRSARCSVYNADRLTRRRSAPPCCAASTCATLGMVKRAPAASLTTAASPEERLLATAFGEGLGAPPLGAPPVSPPSLRLCSAPAPPLLQAMLAEGSRNRSPRHGRQGCNPLGLVSHKCYRHSVDQANSRHVHTTHHGGTRKGYRMHCCTIDFACAAHNLMLNPMRVHLHRPQCVCRHGT